MAGVVFVFAVIQALATTAFRDFQFAGKNLMELVDETLIHWILPLSVLCISLVAGFYIDEKVKRKEFILENNQISLKLYPNWVFILKWVIPAIIIGALLSHVVNLFPEPN